MKKLFYILLGVSSLTMGTSSCSDFLEEENKAGSIAETTYITNSGITGLVSSCYSFTRAWYGKEAGLGLSEMGTDLFYNGYDGKQKSLTTYNLSSESLDGNSTDNPCLDHYWDAFYAAVDVCNNALQYVPINTTLDDKLRNQYLGEVYFLRAFYYWHMVNIWGAIPYNSEPQVAINSNPNRESEEFVYSRILSDIDLSIAAFEAANYKTKKDGRANYWAARALKARTLLYAASWLASGISTNTDYAGKDLYSLAQTEADAVIGSGIASFYDKYADTWSMNNEDITVNKESIWGVAYSSDLLTSANCIPYRYKTNADGDPLEYNSLITRTGYTRGGSAMLLMFVSMWNNGATDFQTKVKDPVTGKDVTYDLFVRVLGTSTSNLKNYKTGESVYVADKYSPYGRGFCRYVPSLYLWNLLDAHRGTDQRTDATLLEAYTIAPGLAGGAKNYPLVADTAIYYCHLDGNSPEGKAKQAWAKGRYRIQFAYNGDIPVYSSSNPAEAKPTEAAKAKSDVYADARYNSYKVGGWASYPGIKKFLDNVYNATYPTHDISSRDAMVFRLAEMYLIKAECQLHTEGGAAAMTTLNILRQKRAITGTDNTLIGEATLETILDERAVELCGEQQRWFDLKRTKTLVSRVKAYNAQAAGSINETHYLRPIPKAQLDAITNKSDVTGTGFWQNPGY